MPQSPHDEFLELCAVSTSGQLTGEEQCRLQVHLEGCPSCSEAMQQYEAVIAQAIPAFAPNPERVESDPSWSQEQAETALFERLTLEEELGTDRRGANTGPGSKDASRVPHFDSQATWRNVWTLYAAGILLFMALGISAYQVGVQRGEGTAAIPRPASPTDAVALEIQLRAAANERDVLRAQITQRDGEIGTLQHEMAQQSAARGRMKLTQNQLEADLQNEQASRHDLLQRQSDLNQKLETEQAKAQGLQGRLDALDQQSSQDKQRAAALEAKAADLTRLLHDREAMIDQQQELLAHDRDIRDLMGARDLYVAEVYDVERTGQTKKPYGRVFYTKGKSLIFYAYDLDQLGGISDASTFQAWGRRGPDRQQALSLGVFFVDNASNKRWVLRFNDPKALAQIDAVFVTVEPNGGSHKPSNRSLLFAYLHIDPNHQ